MAATQISTFVDSEGKVILSWSAPAPDGSVHTAAIALSADAALGLGRALVMRSVKANELLDMFNVIDDFLEDVHASIEAENGYSNS